MNIVHPPLDDSQLIDPETGEFDRPIRKRTRLARAQPFLIWAIEILFFPALGFLWWQTNIVDDHVRELKGDVDYIRGQVDILVGHGETHGTGPALRTTVGKKKDEKDVQAFSRFPFLPH